MYIRYSAPKLVRPRLTTPKLSFVGKDAQDHAGKSSKLFDVAVRCKLCCSIPNADFT